MKNINLFRGAAQPRTVFSPNAANVQEVERVNPIKVANAEAEPELARLRILTQRSARTARRLAH